MFNIYMFYFLGVYQAPDNMCIYKVHIYICIIYMCIYCRPGYQGLDIRRTLELGRCTVLYTRNKIGLNILNLI